MAYSVLSDILEQISQDRLEQLTDDADAGTVDNDVVTRAIVDADAEINSYCSTKYDLPFSPVPVMIRKVSVDIAIYNLFSRRKGAPDDRKERYNNAIRFLKDVSRGVVSLGSDDPVGNNDSGVQTTSSKSDRIFTMGKPSKGTSGTLDNY